MITEINELQRKFIEYYEAKKMQGMHSGSFDTLDDALMSEIISRVITTKWIEGKAWDYQDTLKEVREMVYPKEVNSKYIKLVSCCKNIGDLVELLVYRCGDILFCSGDNGIGTLISKWIDDEKVIKRLDAYVYCMFATQKSIKFDMGLLLKCLDQLEKEGLIDGKEVQSDS